MKYLGSKRKIANEIIPIMTKDLKDGGYFVDAFCGGCNLIDKVPNNFNKIANDNNVYLIEMFKGLQNGVDFPEYIPRDYYVDVRNAYNNRDDSKYNKGLIGWVGFVASNNGRFFDGGYSGHEVVNKGNKIRDYIKGTIKTFKKQFPLLKDIDFRSGSYDEIDLPKPNETVIYCDIPYKGVKQYTTSRHFDYEKFYNWCRQKAKEGYKIFISEYEMPNDFKCIWAKEVNCAVHREKTIARVEKLFTLSKNTL
mgnify:CR=1 FL=1